MELRQSIVQAIEMLMADSNRKFTEKEQDLKVKKWHLALADLSDKHIEYGLMKASRMPNGFMLDSGGFRELCVTGAGSSTIEDEAHKAWESVVKNLNHTANAFFKDSAIAEAVRKIGGWKKLCMSYEKDLPFIKKEFVANYSISKRSGKEFDHKLFGAYENNNIFIGFKNADEEKIMLEKVKKQSQIESETNEKLLGMINGKNNTL